MRFSDLKKQPLLNRLMYIQNYIYWKKYTYLYDSHKPSFQYFEQFCNMDFEQPCCLKHGHLNIKKMLCTIY